MLSRRAFVGKLAAGTAVVSTAGVALAPGLANEGDQRQPDLVAALRPHAERLQRFTAVADARLR